MLRKLTIILAVLVPIALGAENGALRRHISEIAYKAPLRHASWGFAAISAKGDTLAAYNIDSKFVPASNAKIISTGLALAELGASWTFTTTLAHSGEIRDSVLCGDLYIIGGGDPSLGHGTEDAPGAEALFAGWRKTLKDNGIATIDGLIVGDARAIPGPLVNPTWEIGDAMLSYGAGAGALNFRDNVRDPSMDALPGPEEDGPYADSHPALTCARAFCQYLQSTGMEVESYADLDEDGSIHGAMPDGSFRSGALAAPWDSLAILARTVSPTLERIVHRTNHRSDNVYAEAIFRQMGLRLCSSSSFESCAEAQMKALEKMGLNNPESLHIVDGSGLSRHNLVSPGFLVAFLNAMRKTCCFNAFLASLPQPGRKGTVSGRLAGSPDSVKRRVYMKSGSMEGVRCFSGYVMPASGRPEDIIMFSIMVNGCTDPAVMKEIDNIISILAQQ